MNWAEALEWLRTSPLLGITLTVGAYAIGRWLYRRTRSQLAQPVLVAIILVALFLWAFDVDYADYLIGGSYVGFWLGPATVALAIPLHREWGHVRRHAIPVGLGVVIGALVSVVSAMLLVQWAGGGELIQRSMAPKAATTPVSIALAHTLHGQPALTAVVTIIAGITGAVAAPALLSVARVRNEVARGLAIGAASHGLGTARALQESRREGAFAALSMGLSALATSLIVPWLVPLLLR
ncbi:MAG: LrgB family protein [Nocardioidaceae bacterium]|nr:LrgB family protein [Marmoricola sp.]